mmetsp:Transcript_22192/g.48001  ORF Transcript_22192/g.48001 Transcript_22192/m.48001 type:complete len:232 (-) Transcript_22192:169-864(-)
MHYHRRRRREAVPRPGGILVVVIGGHFLRIGVADAGDRFQTRLVRYPRWTAERRNWCYGNGAVVVGVILSLLLAVAVTEKRMIILWLLLPLGLTSTSIFATGTRSTCIERRSLSVMPLLLFFLLHRMLPMLLLPTTITATTSSRRRYLGRRSKRRVLIRRARQVRHARLVEGRIAPMMLLMSIACRRRWCRLRLIIARPAAVPVLLILLVGRRRRSVGINHGRRRPERPAP